EEGTHLGLWIDRLATCRSSSAASISSIQLRRSRPMATSDSDHSSGGLFQEECDFLEIEDEAFELDAARFIVWRPQDGGGMDRGHHGRSERRRNELTALPCHPELPPQE